ncbi:MAG TPA: hypothetical protein VMW27_09415 [Thermoanaerobaculia bacterium]|nr:hypothetical protein [Thermoanaerobaculia bacterium]
MKKNAKKLRLNRDTLANLTGVSAGRIEAAIQTSCTYPCNCPTGCSDEQACIEEGLNNNFAQK